MDSEHGQFEEEREKIIEYDKNQALKMIREWIEKLPDEAKDLPLFAHSTRKFTPMQMLKEVEEYTEEGKKIIESLREVRLRAEQLREER